MKKNLLVVLLVLMFSGFVMSACNIKPTLTGQFKEESYAISIDEVVNFYDELEVKGFDKEQIVLSSSSDDVLSPLSKFEFKGLTSGSAVLFASFEGKTVAQVKVNVKYRLLAPSNVIVDDNGKVSWDKSFVVANGTRVEADTYKVSYKLEEASAGETLEVNENEFLLPAGAIGRYEIKITAMVSDTTIDNSVENTYFVNYGIMEPASNITFTPAIDFTQTATFAWDEIENAIYDVRINGVRIGKDLMEGKFIFDYSRYKVGESIKVEIITKDTSAIKTESIVIINTQVLEKPSLKYNFNGEAYINCDFTNGVDAYLLKIINLNTGAEDSRIYYSGDEFKEILEGFPEGVYELALTGIGGEYEDKYYLNSELSDSITVAKLKTPNVKLSFVGKILRIEFPQDDYINRYMVSWGEENKIFETTNGLVANYNLSDLEAGSYELSIKALPTIDNENEGGVKVFNGLKETNLVLDSDKYIFDFVVLPQLQEITHILEENISTFSFEEVENANFYEIFVNNQKVKAEYFNENGIVKLVLQDFKNYLPENSKYNIRIEAGVKVEDVEHAIRSVNSKTIEILDLISIPSSQVNGSFQWNSLDEECLYYYEIYKTKDDRYDLNGLTALYSQQLSDNKITETLTEGYYTIKITSISIDTNLYLDSDFHNENNVRLVNFIVTKDIISPNVTFKVSDDKYVLSIGTVDKGGEYKVFVDGKTDGSLILSEFKNDIEYILKDNFEAEGLHEVSIIASSGKFDGNIYLDSQATTLNVTRLERADYNVEAVYSVFGELNGFNLNVAEQAGASNIVFKCDGKVMEGDDFQLDMTDETKFGSEFTIEMLIIAGEGSGDNYYINSHNQAVDFERVSSPSMMKYANGVISWDYDDERVEKFLVSIILTNSKASDYPECFFIDKGLTELDIQSKINSLREKDENFDTAYRQSESVKIEIVAFTNEIKENKYIIASSKGSTQSGQNAIVRNQLESPQLTFDYTSKIISWGKEANGTIYDIYLDDELYAEDHNENNFSINEILNEFSRARLIKVQAKNPAYLESDISSAIRIKQLASPNIINIDKVGEDFIASFDIQADTANISGIMVNGTTDSSLINYSLGGNTVNFKLKDFDSDLTIVVKAKNESSTNYYVDSNEVKIKMTDLQSCEFGASTDSERISWTELGSDFSGNNINPITYELNISDGASSYKLKVKGETSILLDEIEMKINAGLGGNVEIKVFAYIDSHYTLNTHNAVLIGYYGQSIEAKTNTKKLAKIESFKVEVIENDETAVPESEIEKTANSSLIVKFDDLWTDFDNIFLNIEVAGEKLAKIPADGIDLILYRLSREAGEYTLYISNTVLGQLNAGDVKVSIYISQDGLITSDKSEFNIKKFDVVKNTVVYDEGVLQINDKQEGASYKVEIVIEDIVVTKVLTDEKSLDLITEELFLNRFGDYTIRLIAVDANGKNIPSSTIAIINGYKLQGIESITIDDNGDINANLYPDDFEGIEFLSRHNNEEKLMKFTRKPDSDIFFTSMIDVLRLYDENFDSVGVQSFDFLVRKKGSINSDYVNVNFDFSREAKLPTLTRNGDLDKDYILFDIDEKTVSIRVSFTVTDMQDENMVTREEVQHYMLEEVLGYWKTYKDGSKGDFVKEKGGEESETTFSYTRKIGLSVNEILRNIFGSYSIEVSRIGFDGEIYYQYRPEVFNLYKLNPVDEDSTRAKIEDNIVRFYWNCEDETAFDPNIRPTSYMLYFKDATGKIVENVTTYVLSYDIRNSTKLLTKVQYNVYIVALYNLPNIIASDEITNDRLSFLIFPEPATLEVKDGKLMFNKEDFEKSDFINDIKTYFQDSQTENYYNVVGEKIYTSPYYFSPATLPNFNVVLKFNRVVNGQLTNEVYTKSIPAYHLFPDVMIDNVVRSGYDTINGSASYFDLLRVYMSTITSNPSADSTRRMIEALNSASKGIGDFYQTFDDACKHIPAGEYQVCVAQSTINSYVESANSAYVAISIAPAPEILLDTQTITDDVTQKTNYIVDVKTILSKIPMGDDNFEDGRVLRYKLQFRENSSGSANDKTIDFVIYYDQIENAWIIDYGEFTDLKYSNRFTSGNESRIIETVDGSKEFKINMSELKNAVNARAGKDVLKINVQYEADIFAYYQDNTYLLNGKSAKFNVRYLDLQAENFIFRDGILSIEAGGIGYELLIKYRHTQDYQEKTSIKPFENKSMIEIELDQAGTYEYIKLSINGSVSRKDLNIESAVYIINNIHKLTAPTITTANGSLSIAYAEDDLRPTGEISFYMGNNESLKEGYEGKDKGYYFNKKYSGEVPLYVVGAINNEDNEVSYPSELIANEYFAYLNGNNGSFVCEESQNGQADFVLSFDREGEVPILSSSTASIKAKMLGNVKSFNIEKGDIKINSDEEIYELIDSTDNEGKILYEVIVDYYYLDNDDNYQYATSRAIYSERLELAEQYISGLAIDTTYNYYKMSVGLIGARKLENSQSLNFGEVRTVEGEKYQIYNYLTYNDGMAKEDQTYVLRGLVNKGSDEIINRTTNPRLSSGATGVKSGSVNFIVDRSVYYAETEASDIAEDTAQRIKVYADIEIGTTQRTSLITGKYSFRTGTGSEEVNNVYVSFIPDEGQLNETLKSFVLKVYAYGKDVNNKNAIISAPLVIRDVYKLPPLKDNYYEVILTEGKTGIDLTKYFENVAIQDNKLCYKIVATAVMPNGENVIEKFTIDSSSNIFIIPSEATRVDLQVQDNQSENELNAKKLLSSDTKRMATQTTTIDELEISWNNILKRFEWEWPEDNSNVYDYVVTVTINGFPEEVVVTDNFYCPRASSGVISENGFSIKARVVDNENDKLSIYSAEKKFIHEAILYNLFSSGEGTQNNPYKINSVEDFKNMALRNTGNYYFELGANIEINISALKADDGLTSIFEEFNAKLNGRNRSLTIISDFAYEMEEFTFDVFSQVKLSSQYYSSIFKTISSTGSVSNISLSYQIKDLDLNNKSVMFAPICLFNYGSIENIVMSEFALSMRGQSGTSTERSIVGVSVGGIVSVNYGNITDCTNGATFNFEAPQMIELTFAYGGIALYNANRNGSSGTIISSFNRRDKSVELSVTNSKLYMAGITLTNIGTISLCGNDSNFTVSDSSNGISANAYFAGITIANKNGTLEYLYNNGRMETSSSMIRLFSSGIVYQIEGGSIQSLIETKSRQPIVKNISTTPTDLGGHYAGNNSGTHTNIRPSELSEIEIDCIDNKMIRIRNVDGDFVATIVQKRS